MEVKRTDQFKEVQLSTKKEIGTLLKKDSFTAEEISAVKEFCTKEMNVTDELKNKMASSASFVIALIKYSKTLSAEECKVVFGMYHTTESEAVKKAIENELIVQNISLAAKIAIRAEKNCNIEYDDLLQESKLHLFEAIHKYDPSYNTKFSTFAFKHIEIYLKRYIENTQSLMKVPNGKLRKYRAFCAFEKKYVVTHPNASDKEIVHAAMGFLGFTEQDIQSITTIRLFTSPEYLETDIWDNNAQIKDLIKDESAETRFKEALDECFRDELLDFLNKVLPRGQYEVLVKYYGLDGSEPMTFREIDEQRENLKGRPGPAAAIKHQKAIVKLKEKHKGQIRKFADSIGQTID